jgi:predicted nucleic acid-binding protein
MTLIADTTVLSNFTHVQRPELLRAECLEDIVTAAQVMEEIQRGVERHVLPLCDWQWLPVYTLNTPEEIRLFEQLNQRLGAGESACLALAMHRGFMVLTDDIDARRWGHHAEIPISGTIGLLVQLVQGRILTVEEANSLLQAMREHGYYAPITRLEELLS